jgi:hypothetical protein
MVDINWALIGAKVSNMAAFNVTTNLKLSLQMMSIGFD